MKGEDQSDGAESDRGVSVDAECSSEVQVPLGSNCPSDGQASINCYRAQRHPSARHQRLKQHVTRAGEAAVASSGGVQARLRERVARLH